MNDLDTGACFEIVGLIIAEAKEDYKFGLRKFANMSPEQINKLSHNVKQDWYAYKDAEEFLFTERLTDFLRKYQIDHLVNATFLRKELLNEVDRKSENKESETNSSEVI